MVEEIYKKENHCEKVIKKDDKNARVLIADDISRVVERHRVRNVDFYIDMAMSWVNDHNDGAYLGCYANKIGDVIIVLYNNGVIYLLGEAYKTIMYAPKLVFRFVNDGHIHIDDVLMKHNSVGNGSIAMLALLLYAKNRGVQVITGTLSSADDDHEARRNGYYEKFGFEIKPKYIIKCL